MKAARLRPRLTLGGLLIIVGGICVWLAIARQRADQQREVVTWVSQVGGFVRYDWQPNPTDQPGDPMGPLGPTWLQQWMGPEYFQSIRKLAVGDPVLDDISPIASQTSLEDLYVSSQYFSYSLEPIGKLTNLKQLTLHARQIDSLQPIQHLPKLQQLEIRDTVIAQSVLDDFSRLRPDVELVVTPPTSKRDLAPGSRFTRDWQTP